MIQEFIHIAVIQFDLVWENPEANRAKLDELFKQTNKNSDVVILPEMFNTGFSMDVSLLAEAMDGETIQWMIKRSSEHQFALCGSLIIRENDQFFNRLVFVEPSGVIHFYDKRHLFTMGYEESHFKKGTKRLIINYKGWRICPLICYDLRFPVWARNKNEYDILIYSANWPQPRTDVWNTLLKARAIENQSYVVGANRVGVDGNSITYSGNSQLIGPKGNMLATSDDYFETIISAEFSSAELIQFRNSFPVLNDADTFQLE